MISQTVQPYSSSYTNQGDIWQATVTPSDGQAEGTPEIISGKIADSPPHHL